MEYSKDIEVRRRNFTLINLIVFLLCLICFILVLTLSGCGVSGSVKTITSMGADGVLFKHCEGTYSNYTFGSAEKRMVNGCDAGGGSEGVDTQTTLELLRVLLQTR